MASDWETTTLGEIFNVKHGFAFKGEYFSETPTNYFLLTPGNFSTAGGFQNTKPKYYDGPILEDYVLKAGQIVVTMTDLSKQSDTLGYAAVIPNDGKVWLHNQRTGLLEFKKEESYDPLFLSYFLRSHEYRSWIIGSATGTTVKHTSPKRIHAFECTLPPLSEQKAIAYILGTLDDKIEINRQMNETLEAMAQALFKSWFVDFDPVIDNALVAGKPIPDELLERAEQRQAVLDGSKANQAIRDLFPDEFEFTEEIGWIPRGWETTQLESLAVISSSKRIFAKEYQTEGVPFFRGKEISLLSKGESFTSDIFISKERFLELKNKFGAPVPGDLLLTSVGTIGNSYLVQEGDEFYFKDGNLTWFSNYKTEIKGGYLSTWFNTRQAYLAIEDIKIGSTQQAITISSLNGIKIVKPKDSVVSLFNKFSEGVISKVSKLRKEKETLTKLRDTLLPKLLSGELRIPDAERLVDEVL